MRISFPLQPTSRRGCPRPGSRVLRCWGAVVACLLVAAAASGQARPGFTGTWVLNQDKSSFEPPENRPTDRTVTLSLTGDTLEHTTDTLRTVYLDVEPFQEKSTTKVSYSAKLDGNEYAIPNSSTRVRLKRVDATSFERTATSGRASETAVWSLSADGRALTVTATGVDAAGKPTRSVQVFERQ